MYCFLKTVVEVFTVTPKQSIYIERVYYSIFFNCASYTLDLCEIDSEFEILFSEFYFFSFPLLLCSGL